MRRFFLILLALASASQSVASAGEMKKDAYLDAPAPLSAADVKAQSQSLQGGTDPVVRKVIADVLAAEATPPAPQGGPVLSAGKSSDVMTAAFIEAKVPDCLHSEGLKRQPTFFLTGLLALPFIPIAKLRGKCI